MPRSEPCLEPFPVAPIPLLHFTCILPKAVLHGRQITWNKYFVFIKSRLLRSIDGWWVLLSVNVRSFISTRSSSHHATLIVNV